MAELDVGGTGTWFDPGLLGAPPLIPELPVVVVLGMLYRASAKSAALLRIISFGSFSGSPGCLGINFCSLSNPYAMVGSFSARYSSTILFY